jgi:hypothetical protein
MASWDGMLNLWLDCSCSQTAARSVMLKRYSGTERLALVSIEGDAMVTGW